VDYAKGAIWPFNVQAYLNPVISPILHRYFTPCKYRYNTRCAADF